MRGEALHGAILNAATCRVRQKTVSGRMIQHLFYDAQPFDATNLSIG